MTCPEFHITRVEDGSRYGLLTERRGPAPHKRTYFYLFLRDSSQDHPATLKPPCTLPPGTEICSISATRYTCLLLDALATYCRHAHDNGRLDLEMDWPFPGQRYSDILFEVFRKRSKKESNVFATCFISRDCFRQQVLQNTQGVKLVGMAASFSVRSASEASFEAYGRYFDSGKSILRWYDHVRATWSRPSGPIRIDFDAGCVAQPSAHGSNSDFISDLRARVCSYPYVFLTGGPHVGKSVSARALLYDLCRSRSYATAHYQHWDRPDRHAFLEELKRLTGILVIDDVHAEEYLYYDIFRLLGVNAARHVLLVGRHSAAIRELCEELSGTAECIIDTTPSPLSQAGAGFELSYRIVRQWRRIEHSQSDNKKSFTPENMALRRIGLSSKFEEFLFSLAAGDVGIAALGLRAITDGEVSCCGAKLPLETGAEAIEISCQNAVRTGIRKHLRELEFEDRLDVRCLVAISVNSCLDCWIAESFLAQVYGIAHDALVDIVRVGEAERTSKNGEFYYRVPHPRRAQFYIECGSEYLPNSYDFLAAVEKYARADYENSLELVAGLAQPSFDELVVRLEVDGTFRQLCDNTPRIGIVSHCLSKRHGGQLGPAVRDYLSSRLESCQSAADLFHAVNAWIWMDDKAAIDLVTFCNKERVLEAITERSSAAEIAWCLCAVWTMSSRVALVLFPRPARHRFEEIVLASNLRGPEKEKFVRVVSNMEKQEAAHGEMD